MDVRRRTLAEGPAGNQQQYNPLQSTMSGSGPSSAMKKPAIRSSVLGSSRMSMAPSGSQGRLSVAPSGMEGAGNFGGAARRSTLMRAQPIGVGEMSAGRGDAGVIGRTPGGGRVPPGSVRRSSVFHSVSRAGALSSMNTIKDPRPIANRAFRMQCQQNVIDYLAIHRCPLPRNMDNVTAKEFQTIFRFLVSGPVGLDPGYSWREKKFEDDVIAILKDLRYPAMENVGKMALGMPGGQNVWPHHVAMLNWLVEMCKAHESWTDPSIVADPLLMPASELPLDHPNIEDRLLWSFVSRTYIRWFDGGAEEFPEQEQELEEVFDRLAASTFDEAEALETEIAKRKAELKQLESQEPPIKRLEQEYIDLMEDKTKFKNFIEQMTTRCAKMHEKNQKAAQAFAETEHQVGLLRKELANLESAVAAQNLSPDEVMRMTNERESLQRQLDDVRIKVAESKQQSYDHEMLVTKAMDRFEQLLQDYTVLGDQIGILDSSNPDQLGPNGINYSLDLDITAQDAQEVQRAGKRMREVIWPALQTYSEGFRKQALELGNGAIALEDELDQLTQTSERQKEEIGNWDAKLKIETAKADDAKAQLHSESQETNATVVALEDNIANISCASQQSVLAVQSQLESTKIAFKELRHKTGTLQDQIVVQLMGHIDVIIKAKEHAANSLKGVRTFAEAN